MTRRAPDPSTTPIARCWTKAISGEQPGRTLRSEKWLLARRERHLRTEFRTEALRLGYSPFSIVLRLVLLGYLGYLLWSRLS